MKIEMKGIDKAFGSAKVLKNAEFSINSGEIHALMGENGAGKSTLMKILTGVYTKDNGSIFIDGKEIEFNHPKEAEKAGIVFIHQELNVLPHLTVEQNLFLGKEIKNKFGALDTKKMKEESSTILKKLGVVDIDPNQVLGELSIGKQQMVEIAKALMVDTKFLIMDEPTAALTPRETEALFKVVRSLKEKGVAMIYISHRMEEIFDLCEKITILRDGEYVGTKNICDTDMNDVVKMMIGREIGERFPKVETSIGETVLKTVNLTKNGAFKDISFEVKAGEILGVSGLMGAGRTEIMQAIFGNLAIDDGHIELNGEKIIVKNPLHAIKLGIGFITEDRKTEGLLLDNSIRENISIANLQRISNKFGVINSQAEKELSNKGSEDFKIRCTGIEQICGGLSGGNQQKVVFAKWVATNPKVLILDEPTRGVDIGAKKEIYNIINQLVLKGVAVILVSSELPEVLGMSDRVMVIHEGKLSGILDAKEATQEKVMILSTGGTL